MLHVLFLVPAWLKFQASSSNALPDNQTEGLWHSLKGSVCEGFMPLNTCPQLLPSWDFWGPSCGCWGLIFLIFPTTAVIQALPIQMYSCDNHGYNYNIILCNHSMNSLQIRQLQVFNTRVGWKYENIPHSQYFKSNVPPASSHTIATSMCVALPCYHKV